VGADDTSWRLASVVRPVETKLQICRFGVVMMAVTIGGLFAIAVPS
jgi:hypothetical protein